MRRSVKEKAKKKKEKPTHKINVTNGFRRKKLPNMGVPKFEYS